MLPGLKFARLAKGLTQYELAEVSGVHRDSIQKLETGQRPARPATIKKLADTLGVRTEELAQEKEGNRMSPEQTIEVPAYYPDFENADIYRKFDGSNEAWIWDELLDYRDRAIVESLAIVLNERVTAGANIQNLDLPGIAEALWRFDREGAEKFVKDFGVQIADRSNEMTGLFDGLFER
jgi:transcriptional regulator with XRE-family HTH domain